MVRKNFLLNNPRMVNSIVCFIDILGFTEMIKTKCKNGEGNELLSRLYNSLNRSYELINITLAFENTKIFTDNIIISCPIQGNGEKELSSVLYSLLWYQYQLTLEGFFIRGGVSVGDNYMDENIVFGPALIDAYEAESKLANSPRIILDKKCTELHEKINKQYLLSGLYSEYAKYLEVGGDDGILFVNYLSLYKNFPSNDICNCIYDLEKHKCRIVENLEFFKREEDDPQKELKRIKIRDKYLWVAEYHNNFCKENYKNEKNLHIKIEIY